MPEMHPDIKKALEEHGEDWVVAALVNGSIGYHTPDGARLVLEHYLSGGRRDWCERCLALFSGDLEKMLVSDIQRFFWLQEHRPRQIEAVVAYYQAMRGRSCDEQMTGSLLYPTHGP